MLRLWRTVDDDQESIYMRDGTPEASLSES
jgi:hypothetical protein